jgi:hypothetical protein
VVGQHAVAVIIGGWLCELARTRDIAASHVEPIPLHPPPRNVRHDGRLSSNLPRTWFRIMPPMSYRKVHDRKPRTYGIWPLRPTLVIIFVTYMAH